MAGIYIHTPFCQSRCIYCGFFSTTQKEKMEQHTECICRELNERSNYIQNDVATIYFGGGTPSQLPLPHIKRILNTIYNIYNVRAKAEITLEANPDDLSLTILEELKSIGINRLSIGVQSFNDTRLQFIHRRHNAEQARKAVRAAQEAGFENISIDLMFGFPNQTMEEWQSDLSEAICLQVQHISAYSLMYEENTPLGKMLEQGDVHELPDETCLAMYDTLIDALECAGFEHYEISNFAIPGYQSKHNSSYWNGTPYLGVGAGAHSYNGTNRHYNPDSLNLYLSGAEPEEEILDNNARYDEFVFTALRTSTGLNLNLLKERYGENMHDYCLSNAQPHINNGMLTDNEGTLKLTRKGLFVSNDIMSDLMMID